MKKRGLFILLTIGFIAGYDHASLLNGKEAEAIPTLPSAPHRIISLAPSITETLFALGLGEKVVGVTRYCNYPPQALTKSKVGGYLDPNLEAIVALRADLVISFPDSSILEQRLTQLGIPTLQVQHQTLKDILASIRTIGAATNKAAEARGLLTTLKLRMKEIKRKTADLSRPQVLVVMGRPLKEVFIAGINDPYDEMIRIAGGMNAYQGDFTRIPSLSAEGLIHLNPEVIIELVTNNERPKGWSVQTLLQDWDKFSEISAVKIGRIYFFTDDFDTVPGPRFILTLEKMARAIHPEINWTTP